MAAPYSDDLYSDLPVEHHHPDSPHPELEAPDEEDISHLLSPADGFRASSWSRYAYGTEPSSSDEFALRGTSQTVPTSAGVPNMPNVLVPDPGLEQRTADAKAREARRDRGDSLNMPTSPDAEGPTGGFALSDTSSPGRSTAARYHPPWRSNDPRHIDETRSSSSVSEAPPAYTPSPTSPLSSDGSSEAHFATTRTTRNYQTFPSIETMGRGGETRWLLSGSGPESMVAREDGGEPESFFRRKKEMSPRRLLIVKVLLVALVLSAVGGIIGGIVTGVKRARGSGEKEHQHEVGQEHQHKGPPDDGKSPLPSGPLDGQPWPACAPGYDGPSVKHYGLSFGPGHSVSVVQTVSEGTISVGHGDSVNVVQTTIGEGTVSFGPDHSVTVVQGGRRQGTMPQVRGYIILRRVESGQEVGIDVEVITNDASIQVTHEWDARKQDLTITTPRAMEWSQKLSPCIQMRITVSVPEGAELEGLEASSVSLKIKAESDSAVKSTYVALNTVSGDVVAEKGSTLDSRSIEIHTISGDITGSLPLFDSLDLGSASGKVDIDVDLKPVLPSRPLPAVFTIGTVSGHVRVREPINDKDKVPPRDYRVDVGTTSGNVDVAVAFSSKLKLESRSGKVTAVAQPVLDDRNCGNPVVDTQTYSGNTDFTLREPFWAAIDGARLNSQRDNTPLGCLRSSHSNISGKTSIKYPSSWSGAFTVDSISGRIDVRGRDVELDSSNGIFSGMKKVRGHKGNGNSAMTVDVISGNVDILIGEE